jgi:hypothetical protein
VTRHRPRAAWLSLALGLALAACSSAGVTASGGTGGGPTPSAHWVRFRHLPGVVDLAGPARDGGFTVAAAGRLFTLSQAGAVRSFARGPGGYAAAAGEPYISMPATGRVAGTQCSFPASAIFAIRPSRPASVLMIGADGRASRFVTLPRTLTLNGITADTTGRFGHALLVTAGNGTGTTVLAINCAGGVRTITGQAPHMEGGMSVAPASFGRYGGDLIGPDESTGRVYAITPDGTVHTLIQSRLPHGGDIGVESTGFVPPGFGADGSAYLADRFSRGNKHPGTNSILRLPGTELIKAGVRPGDLLVATEGSARTIDVRCAAACTVRYIAIGLAVSHAEGHIVFSR